ncbi:hypothetical protein WKR88_14895 [Trinickia caryophylli]|uniref:Uncharacterized protein n=1 Tax=Trinickia caryophylli TaxID=28094 RepID=A0A1X7FN75_TRICW|nr:hypothetical protein [Trinickia caryophylli]PMS13860.1 hypothetical protein C0Z17_03075 [Trinickia caryophylli]TRX14355.1 hypothetical protein FNF07_24035 [Trinickia caryophylli]WQE14190.1 hypothetical protein U0034_26230 [Trinickia caryophylli]SMF55322.1 hypothetical protein SAMN06295900_11046 [Trinickia caryophylli]
MQTKGAVKFFSVMIKFSEIAFVLVIVIYAVLSVLDRIYPEKFYRCDKYTKLLNGGEKMYEGRRLNVVLCGTGPDKNRMNDKIRLQIFSENHSLLAQRKFFVDWDTNADRELVYSPDRVTYFDSSQENDYVHSVRMPPTWWDWVKARLPLFS